MSGLFVGSTRAAETGTALVLYTWEEYLAPSVVSRFEQETGIRIHQQYYDTDESKNEVLAATDRGRGFDLLVGSGLSLRALGHSNWFAPLPEADMPNLRHLHSKWRDVYGELREFAVPYFWGTLGLAYRSDLVEKPDSWMDFFRPAESLHGKLLLIDDSKDAVGMALKALGFSIVSTDIEQLAAAEALLRGVRPHLRTIGYFDVGGDAGFANGELLMAMSYSGDALALAQKIPTLAYVVPREGTNVWVDFITVLASSSKQAEAFRFIDFLNRPEIAAANARYVHYASPNRSAEKLLPKEMLNDPVLYPPAEVLERSETYESIGIQGMRQRIRILSGLQE